MRDPTTVGPPVCLDLNKSYWGVKRLMDVLFSLLALPIVLPAMIVCAIAVGVDSAGPIIFGQERIGKDGRRFRMYKFRTMHADLDDSHHRASMQAFVRGQMEPGDMDDSIHKPIHSHEVTRVGRVLRKTSLDELPQFINVLKGEMSLVGPRPNVPYEVEAYADWHKARLAVLPGITGLAQIQGRSAVTFDNIVEYDIEYIARQSLLLDLSILVRTIPSVILTKGAR